MTAKITISTTDDKVSMLADLSKKLNLKKNEVFEKALQNYADKIELQKWENGAIKASQNDEYLRLSEELGNEGSEIHAY